ncbi:hypothetical protein BaRGS_00039173 [Batillaria attramentaria]|uniref:Uncharacterized protein n=1 Tax=Batillaria attramentaria TaxID=370345 RepID=A0ABD0J3S8_9CAEN
MHAIPETSEQPTVRLCALRLRELWLGSAQTGRKQQQHFCVVRHATPGRAFAVRSNVSATRVGLGRVWGRKGSQLQCSDVTLGVEGD